MEAAPASIVYEDDEIRLVWQPGRTGYVLITFSDLVTPADGDRFYADTPVRKAGITALGVVAKRGNWFPAVNMQAARPVFERLLGPYASRVTYGGSMGGYAAIKFSRLLGATEAIALCPQWTLDAAEFEGGAPGWENYFTPTMRGMGIRAGDVSGQVFVFVDLFDPRDALHCRMIQQNCPGLQVINVPMVGHHITAALAGTQNLRDLIAACRARQVPDLIRLSRSLRRDIRLRLRVIAAKAISRHPSLIVPILAAMPADDHRLLDIGADHLFRVADWLVAHGDKTGAVRYVQSFRKGLRDPRAYRSATVLLNAMAGQPTRIVTVHGTALVFDLEQGRCTHTTRTLAVSQAYVRLHLAGNRGMLFAELGGMRFDLWLDNEGYLVSDYTLPEADLSPWFEVMPLHTDAISIQGRGRFLSADANEKLICDRPLASAWEWFRLD